MSKKSFFWQILLPFLVTLTLLVVIATTAMTVYITNIQDEKSLYQLEGIARTYDMESATLISQSRKLALQEMATKLADDSKVRVTVIDVAGNVVAESGKDLSDIGPHEDRPEVIDALNKGIGKSIRFSWTLKEDMAYVAVPLSSGGAKLGVLRVSRPLSSNAGLVFSIIGWAFLAWLFMSSIATIIALYIYRQLFFRLAAIKNGVDRFAKGDFKTKHLTRDFVEFALVAASINKMAQTLDKRVQDTTKRLGQQDAILGAMAEGVIAVDRTEKVINIYKAAAATLDVNPEDAVGKNIHEVVRNRPLIRLIERTLAGSSLTEDEIVLLTESGEKNLLANATVFVDDAGVVQGVVLVLNDITRLKRLEGIRRDFVSNVSHELRTPITSIKGSVETLLDGAIDEKQNAQRFLGIILKQIERLSAIIEDLLLLSRIEQEEEKGDVLLHTANLCKVLSEAVTDASGKATEKSVEVKLECPEGLSARVNERLLEQAVFNLLDNAIKYSESGGSVRVLAKAAGSEVTISVADRGIGIAKEHIDRLFERFYRVDKGRSRKEGGTGLGLAIVKHIIGAHGGHVTVQSEPGVGSTFTIHLPRE